MARAIVNNFGKSACYVSIGQLTSNLYTREVAESVQASVNAAIDEEIALAIPEKELTDGNKFLGQLHYVRMVKINKENNETNN
jgi:hypothetical protein